MQSLQHQSVAAERHHDIGVGGIVIAVELYQLCKRLLGLRDGARDEGDPVISLRASHEIAGSYWRWWDRVRRGRLYDLGCPCRDHWTYFQGANVRSGGRLKRPLDTVFRSTRVGSIEISADQYLATTGPARRLQRLQHQSAAAECDHDICVSEL